MPWSSGVFSRTDGTRTGTTVWQQAKAAAIKILAVDHDTHDQDLATGINNCLTKDGQNSPSADLPMNSKKHTNVANASARTEYATAGQVQDGSFVHALETGTANAYAIAPSPPVTAYATGQVFRFAAQNANTGASTLDVAGLGAKAIKKDVSGDLASGDIGAGEWITVIYDGANFQLAASPTDISGKQADVVTTRGDLVVGDGTPTASRLALGATGEYLRSDGTDAAWAALQGTDMNAPTDSVRGAIRTADKADMEAETADAVAVRPGTFRHAPAAAKMWGIAVYSGGVPTLSASYNVTSISDDATGLLGVTIADDFSSTSWAPGAYSGTSTGDRYVSNTLQLAGSMQIQADNAGGAPSDPSFISFWGFGDQ